jgi:hypothetical protein
VKFELPLLIGRSAGKSIAMQEFACNFVYSMNVVYHPDLSNSVHRNGNSTLHKSILVRFEVLTAVTMMNAAFLDIKHSSYLTGDTLRHITSPLQSPAV